MKYAVIKLDGRQFKVTEGQTLKVNRQPEVNLNFQILSYSNGTDLFIGNPYLTDVEIKTSVLREEKGEKVTIQRFKAKSRYRVKKGHRQPLTVFKIDQISKEGESVGVKETKVKEVKPVVRKTAKTVTKTPKVLRSKEKVSEKKKAKKEEK